MKGNEKILVFAVLIGVLGLVAVLAVFLQSGARHEEGAAADRSP